MNPVLRQVVKAATTALSLKRQKEERVYRRALCESIHIKQVGQFEEKFEDTLDKFFKDQLRDVRKKLWSLGDTVTIEKGTEQEAQQILNQVYDPKAWHEKLVDVTLPVMTEMMGKAAAAELKILSKSLPGQSKESAATRWLMEEGYTELPPHILTEFPESIKQEIVNQLRETYQEDYWQGINETTRDDIFKFLEEGTTNGDSIRKMAQRIMDSFSDYTRARANNVARTESGNALNGARRAAMDAVIADMPEEVGKYMRPSWMSVLGTTTRLEHANLDGVPADKDGMWTLADIRVPWPGHRKLTADQRCNCQCTILMEFGITEQAAMQQVQEYHERIRKSIKVFCPTGPGGGVDPTCSPGGVSASSAAKGKLITREEIAYGDNLHLEPYPGDNGIQYEKDEEAAEYEDAEFVTEDEIQIRELS